MRFDPTGSKVGVLLPGDRTGPTEHQRATYREVTARWSSLADAIAEACYPTYCIWFSNSPLPLLSTPQDLYRSLTLCGFQFEHPTLYPFRKQFQDFDVAFTLPGDTTGHDLVVHVKNWEVIRASMEG